MFQRWEEHNWKTIPPGTKEILIDKKIEDGLTYFIEELGVNWAPYVINVLIVDDEANNFMKKIGTPDEPSKITPILAKRRIQFLVINNSKYNFYSDVFIGGRFIYENALKAI